MQEFFRLIYAQNMSFICFLIFLAVILWAVISSYLKKGKVWFFIICDVIVFVSIFITILYRTLLVRDFSNTDFEFVPFKCFFTNDDLKAVIRSFFMNIVLFVPLGLSMPYVLSKNPRKRNVFITICFACVLSASIEFLQYYYHLGRCETDDVIANTLGAAVGTLSYCLYIHILKNREKGSLMQKSIDNNQKLLLDLCAKSLFEKDITVFDELDSKSLIEESKRQTVFPCIYFFVKDKCDTIDGKTFSQIIAKNIRVEYGHNEVHNILTDNAIPYVVLKGVASAAYYKEPMLRMMGDVDVLVAPENIAKADMALKSIGFITDDVLEGEGKHIAYKRRDGLVCELHREINGIPKNAAGEKIKEYFSDLFEKSVKYNMSNGSCVVPGEFHHGLILVLHTATHLTSEGVGLRHLCDWAVFVNGFTNDEFVALFEKPLKEMGLWRFAQLLTQCCVKHLACDIKEWAGEANDDLIDSIISDILNSGNFGTKDSDRYNQIKYISDRKEGTTAKKKPILQLFSSINQKAKKEFKFANKSKFFLPIGWIFTVCKYLYLVIMGKRRLDSASTISGAKQRKEIYNEFKLFKNDQA